MLLYLHIPALNDATKADDNYRKAEVENKRFNIIRLGNRNG